jgi:hypothetical protein
MPTLILLDNSLSMCKYTSNSELEIGEKSLSILNISQIMILEIIKSIKTYDTKESVALVSQSLKCFDLFNHIFSN